MSVALGVAGTAKNTGKTTALAGLMGEGVARGWRMGLTSIGFDGEEVDNITGLPKPRLFVERGIIVATAGRCVEASTASLKVIGDTPVESPLGRVMVAEVQRPGLVVLAGPVKSGDLRVVLDDMRRRRCLDIVLVDGAFARISPMVEADALILATGAARNPDIESLAVETEAVVRVLGLPQEKEMSALSVDKLFVGYAGGEVRGCAIRSVLTMRDAAALRECLLKWKDAGRVQRVFIPGAVNPALLLRIVTGTGDVLKGAKVVFADPLKLLVCGDPASAASALRWMKDSYISVAVSRAIRLLGITVNPFYPVRLATGAYEPHFVDAVRLAEVLRARTGVKVWDVVLGGTEEIGTAVEEVIVGRRRFSQA